MRPEDFPPGVAYLPPDDNDDEEEPTFEPSSDGIIDFAASIETVKNVMKNPSKLRKKWEIQLFAFFSVRLVLGPDLRERCRASVDGRT